MNAVLEVGKNIMRWFIILSETDEWLLCQVVI